jgi:hypothetical protein
LKKTVISIPQITSFIDTKPFRPFSLETSGGNWILVETAAHIKLPPPNHDLIIVYGTDGLVYHLAKDTITNAAVFGPAPRPKEL